jgi:hypothetical protein
MFNDLRLWAQDLAAKTPERIKWQVAAASCAVAFVFLLIALPVTPPKHLSQSAAPVADVASSAQPKPDKAVEKSTVAKPVAILPPVSAAAPAPIAQPAPDAKLFKRLYAEYPELDPGTSAYQALDDWSKVSRLREFSYRHTAFAAGPDQLAYRAGAEMIAKVVDGKATLADAYGFFDRAQGGVQDSEAAELLRRLYAAAGFEAFELECGFRSTQRPGIKATHALSLVRITTKGPDGKSRSILSVQDPSLNVGNVDSQGRPIDYFEMLKLLGQRQADQIHFAETSPNQTSKIVPITVAFNADLESTLPTDFAAAWNLSGSPVWSAGANGNWIAKGPRTIWSFERVGDVAWKPELFQAGLPPESIYLHCFPLQIRGGVEGPALLKTARQSLYPHAMVATQAAGNATL